MTMAASPAATMERPALQRLLADIGARLIDVVVVYKVDRLTRSLADFAKLVEIFEAHGVSFVSVTQQFNTTTSMGRLTLNVLLSFAQFEREVTGERIRDKFAASRRKGMWMGGNVPLGYDVKHRKLVVNEAEAKNGTADLRAVSGVGLRHGTANRTRTAWDSQQATGDGGRPGEGRRILQPRGALSSAQEPGLSGRRSIKAPRIPASTWRSSRRSFGMPLWPSWRPRASSGGGRGSRAGRS